MSQHLMLLINGHASISVIIPVRKVFFTSSFAEFKICPLILHCIICDCFFGFSYARAQLRAMVVCFVTTSFVKNAVFS